MQKKVIESVVVGVTMVSVGAAVSAKDDVMNVIGEVVVTATKREENLQNVPISITAFDSQVIEQARLQSVEDIVAFTPGFFSNNLSPSSPELTLRGIGSTDREAASDRSVVIFADEVYIGRTSASTFDMFDAQRVEVLRGPQGTIFGRNVVGGLVHVVSNKPDAQELVKLQGTVGNYNLYELKGVVNSPLTDNLFGRMSFNYGVRDGFVRNIVTGGDLDDKDTLGVRGQLKYVASDELEFLLQAEYSRDDIDGISSVNGPNGAPFKAPIGYTPPDGFYEATNSIDGYFDRDLVGISLRADWEVGPGTLTSLSAYRLSQIKEARDYTGVALNNGPTGDRGFVSLFIEDEDYSTLSQELRLTSSESPQRRFDYVAGLYFLAEQTDRGHIRHRILNTNGVFSESRPLFDQKADTTSFAVFGEGTYHITDKLDLTAGARWTRDSKDYTLDVVNTDPTLRSLNPAEGEFSAAAKKTWSELTPKVTISYQLSDDVMLYGLVSQGYKSGGWTGEAPNQAAAETPFDPEFAWNYELGLKSRLFQDRLQLNLTGFHVDYSDLQLRRRVEQIPGNPASIVQFVVNAGSAEIDGVELELIAKLLPGLSLSGSYAYLDTEIKRLLNNPEFEGDPLPRAPKHSYATSLDWELPIPLQYGSVLFGVDYRVTGESISELGDLLGEPVGCPGPVTPCPGTAGTRESYDLLDMQLVYEFPSLNSRLAFWVKNLLQEEYYAQLVTNGERPTGNAFHRAGDPRTYGATFTVEF